MDTCVAAMLAILLSDFCELISNFSQSPWFLLASLCEKSSLSFSQGKSEMGNKILLECDALFFRLPH